MSVFKKEEEVKSRSQSISTDSSFCSHGVKAPVIRPSLNSEDLLLEKDKALESLDYLDDSDSESREYDDSMISAEFHSSRFTE